MLSQTCVYFFVFITLSSYGEVSESAELCQALLRNFVTLYCVISIIIKLVLLHINFCFSLFVLLCSEVGKLLQVQNGTPPTTNYNGVDAVHACNILQQLKALYDEAQLTDIVVEVDHGKTFSCHRNVLAAISPYFR